ncbi:MAG: glycoside hydrolase family 125 protein [Candidatus Limnocylindria bacterium]
MDGRRHRLSDSALSATELDRRKPYKPLDVGNGIVSGTLTPGGRWLSLGTTHPMHGRIVLTTMEPFTGGRLIQSEVRAYRAALADPKRPSFGFDLLDAEPSSVRLLEDSFPSAIVELPEGRLESTAFAPPGRSGAVQVVRITARSEIRGPTWRTVMHLGRAEYTQLTPGGPLPPAPTQNRASMHQRAGSDETIYLIDDPFLDACAAIVAPYAEIAAGSAATVVFAIALGRERSTTMAEARDLARRAEALLDRELSERRRLWSGLGLDDDAGHAARRGVSYAIECAASRSNDAVALLADHEILPLVWTRDAYYVCRALLAVGPHDPHMTSVVEGFIRWTFEVAERVDGGWPRASLASGKAKDRAFQLDQQLWPLLLIADHARLSGDASLRERYEGACADVIERLLAARTPFGLIATAETPADDPLVQPFHFSSHVLLWRALAAFDHPGARDVQDATLRHFESAGRFAYAVAGPDATNARHYHDANDFPTVFAPGWGFCSADDPRWRATIDFAWSIANEGYFAGTLAGLGSVHTPHPWPLGDLQEIVLARVTSDPTREQRAKERLTRVETWDGMLPEAYDEGNGAVASRHWFAWPAALRALLEREPMLTAP